jgi:glutamate-1-semialdehyde 2,1-aminomutase
MQILSFPDATTEQIDMKSFHASEEQLRRAERVIPLGSQTFSKSRTQYPVGVSPLFVVRAKGAYCWDVDGNQYLDMVNGLAAITLGHADPDVTNAVKAQIDEGVLFSLPHPVETEVAELLCEMVPSAELVRFGKNGSDATAGAIRLARAFTGRDRVAVCGYHGWQDWYIGSTARHLGVPQAVRSLTHVFPYGDVAALHSLLAEHPGQFAAVIMEPMNVTIPYPDYLSEVRDVTHRNGALFVLDETITGFRFALGGAQELFGVRPDLSTFGKGMANGYPVSALVGRGDVMRLMEKIFFSFTFGGEGVSLAAAKATLQKLRREPVLATLQARGLALASALEPILSQPNVSTVFGLQGHPTWQFLTIRDTPLTAAFVTKTLLMQELHQAGILSVGTHNFSFAHSEGDVAAITEAYARILPIAAELAIAGGVQDALRCQPLEPLFKVR